MAEGPPPFPNCDAPDHHGLGLKCVRGVGHGGSHEYAIDEVIVACRSKLHAELELDAWKAEDDKPLPEDPQIEAAFPTRSGRHDLYADAMRLVGARWTKGGLVALVNWLLHRAEQPKPKLSRCEASFGYSEDPEQHRRCGRKATHLAIDDDGDTFRFCGRCVRQFEGGMREVRKLGKEGDST